jgi:peroxiredoxin Q/BCP
MQTFHLKTPCFSTARLIGRATLFLAVSMLLFGFAALAQTPAIAATAPDFTLSTPSGAAIRMSSQEHGNQLVLVILRGFPGYQCPYCQKQVHDFVEHAADFAAKKATVLLVYPGPPADLDQHAREFLASYPKLPPNVILVTDPDYEATNLYGLRWDAPHETAYPSTFVLDKHSTVLFEKISHSHGDRISAKDVLDHLSAQ